MAKQTTEWLKKIFGRPIHQQAVIHKIYRITAISVRKNSTLNVLKYNVEIKAYGVFGPKSYDFYCLLQSHQAKGIIVLFSELSKLKKHTDHQFGENLVQLECLQISKNIWCKLSFQTL